MLLVNRNKLIREKETNDLIDSYKGKLSMKNNEIYDLEMNYVKKKI